MIVTAVVDDDVGVVVMERERERERDMARDGGGEKKSVGEGGKGHAKGAPARGMQKERL